ncbi:MAG: PQQ-binding-like beta-propeller repeat protein [Pirellulaceae bacterium]
MKLPITYRAIVGTALVAGMFSLTVGLLLTIDFARRGEYELFDSPRYVELKERLAENPGDPRIREEIRRLDRRLRMNYFSHRQFMDRGVLLLIGGVTVALVAARWAASMRPQAPSPELPDEEVDPHAHEQLFGRRAVAAVVATTLVLMCGVALQADRILPASMDELAAETKGPEEDGPAGDAPGRRKKPAPPTRKKPMTRPLPSDEEYQKQWPRFRGPTGSGKTPLTDIPREWNVSEGEGIAWKVNVPLPGPNSPVVWDDRVFLSGATVDEQALFCFQADTGELMWQLDVPVEVGNVEEFEVEEYTGYAAPTMATDGARAYAIFASGNLVASDFQGSQLWRENLGVPENNYGHASSLATHEDLVIVQYDQGQSEDDLSRLIAFEGATGDIAWEVSRSVPTSWATPIVVKHDGRPMVITCVDPWVIAYHADNGEELWRADCLSGEVGPSPVFSDGVVYAANEMSGMFAIRADGEGDVTETHIEWFTDFDVPDVSSPLVTDQHAFTLSYGLLAAFELGKSDDLEEPREPLWEEDLWEDVSSSPGYADQLLYLFSKSDEGKGWIIKASPEAYEQVAEFEMGEPVRSSPAFMPGRIYIRGKEHLFCIGK